MSKTEFYLSKIVKYGLYAVLLTPLAFWPKALYAFMTPKFILFQVLVEIVFGAWILLAVLNKEYRPKFSWLTAALIFFAVVSLISALFGVDLTRSVWGIGARMTGLFAELHFLAWLFVLVSYFKNKEEWNRYLNTSFAVSILVALTAFYQNSQWHLVPGYTIFSNPTFAAPYFLFHFFWGLYQTINLKSSPYGGSPEGRQISNLKNWRNWFFAGGSVLILVALLTGGVRGAFIGLVIGVFFLGIGLIFSDILKPRQKVLILLAYGLLFIGAVGLWMFRDSDFIQKIEVLKRLSLISLSETTAQIRLLTWQSALEGFQSAGWRMFLGAGPENFNYLFNAHYNPRLLQFGGVSFAETWQDKPHNAFIEILAETGIIGGLAYISIWLFAVFYLFRIFKRGEKFLSLALAGAFISYFGTVFFSFDSFGSWFGLYLMLGFLASHNNTNLSRFYRGLSTKSEQIYPNSTNINQNLKKIFVVFACISILGLLGVNLSIWRANIADADALRIFSNNPAQGIVYFKKSLIYFSPYKSEYQFDFIASIAGAIEKGIPLPNLEDTINFSLSEADKAVAAHPKDAAKYTDMIRIYNILGTRGRDPEILVQADIFGKKSLELSPQRQETLFYLARTALLRNDAKAAVTLAKQAVLADPDIKQSHWYLGLAYIANNQRQEGLTEIKKALEMGYKPQNAAEEAFIKNLGL